MIVAIPEALREKLGPEGTRALAELLNEASVRTRDNVIEIAASRFEHQMGEEIGGLRAEFNSQLHSQIGSLRTEMYQLHADLVSRVGAVPWGQRWRPGADEATLMITQRPLMVGSLEVPAGVYSLYMMPVEEGTSQLIINRQFGQWGMGEPYQENMELGRVDLSRESVDERVDQLTLTLERAETGGLLRITWENLSFTASFTVGQ